MGWDDDDLCHDVFHDDDVFHVHDDVFHDDYDEEGDGEVSLVIGLPPVIIHAAVGDPLLLGKPPWDDGWNANDPLSPF
jgi:hypothetical protein